MRAKICTHQAPMDPRSNFRCRSPPTIASWENANLKGSHDPNCGRKF